MQLWRAADNDTWVDCASFAETREVAEQYLNNPGYGGSRLWAAEVDIDPETALNVVDERDPTGVIADRVGRPHPGAIGADEYAPRVSDQLRDAGVCWVRVRESFPADTVTWIYVGGDDFELTEVG